MVHGPVNKSTNLIRQKPPTKQLECTRIEGSAVPANPRDALHHGERAANK